MATKKKKRKSTKAKAQVKFKALSPDAVIPERATKASAGLDLHAAEAVTIVSGSWTPVRTGLAIELPVGYEAQVRSRSGLSFKYGVAVLNSPGTVDADFRGEILVILINHGPDYSVKKGDRIAQLVIQKLPLVEVEIIEGDLSSTARGSGGFGSTGR